MSGSSRGWSDNLMLLDYDRDITAISSQPFVLRWHDGVRDRKHTPDYFARRAGPAGGRAGR
jgi:hypothetical protein